MNLLQALEIESTIGRESVVLAFTGSGGKTTALFNLARQFVSSGAKSVWISTTTHLAVGELQHADHIIFIKGEQDWSKLEAHQAEGIVVVCGPEDKEQRVAGLSVKGIERLHRFIFGRKGLLILEADGSRRRSLKAPAEHEPVVPSLVQHVVVVAGLSGLGKPLNDEYVHRPERFAELAGLRSGDLITPIDLARVLAHPQGGLKNISPSAQRTIVLNQADTLDGLDEVQEIADHVQQSFPRVIVASLGVKPDQIQAIFRPVAGIILAAGSASRFGAPKQIMPWRGKPLVHYAIQAARKGGLYPIRVITGAHQAQVKAALSTLPEVMSGQVELVFNPKWEEGVSTSIHAGLNGVSEQVSGAVFLLADQPHIPYQLVRALRQAHAQTRSWAVVPTYKGRRVNPVLFGRELFSRLLALQGDTGGRALLREKPGFPITWVPWDSSNLDFDIDEPLDYQHFLEIDNP